MKNGNIYTERQESSLEALSYIVFLSVLLITDSPKLPSSSRVKSVVQESVRSMKVTGMTSIVTNQKSVLKRSHHFFVSGGGC